MIGAIAAATRRIRVGSGGVMLPNHAPLMVAERFKVLEALYPGPHRSRHRSCAGHRPADLAGAAPAPGGAGRRRFPGAVSGAAGLAGGRLSRGPSVPVDPGDARGRPGAADLAPGLQRLQRRAGGSRRARLRLRPTFRQPGRRHSHRTLPGELRAVALARRTARHPHRGCDLCRDAGGGRAAGGQQRLWTCAARPRRIRAAGQSGGGSGPSLDTGGEVALRRANRARLFVGEPAALRDRLSAFAAQVGATSS